MVDKILYWIYLEPYTFIFEGKEGWVLYNTVNSVYMLFKDAAIIDLLRKLLDPYNGYIIPVDRKLAKDKNVINFVRNIRKSFSGDIVSDIFVKDKNKPFIFMPILRLYNDVNRIKKERGKSLGELILRNLSEVTFFLSTECAFSCKYCGSYKQQFIHCSKFVSKICLSVDAYFAMFHRLKICGVDKMNFVLSDLSDEKAEILKNALSHSFKIEIYIDIRNINDRVLGLVVDNDIILHVTFSFVDMSMESILEKVMKYKDYKICWECIVSSIEDLTLFNEFSFLDCLKMIPLYTGDNLSFFEKFVYLSLDDIVSNKIDKRQIFRRQVLNENFFGKLYILPSGAVYTNMNMPAIGNINENSLGEIIYREFDNSQSWLKIRDGKICGNCENRYLCPSISNYELVIGKENLCHMYGKK